VVLDRELVKEWLLGLGGWVGIETLLMVSEKVARNTICFLDQNNHWEDALVVVVRLLVNAHLPESGSPQVPARLCSVSCRVTTVMGRRHRWKISLRLSKLRVW